MIVYVICKGAEFESETIVDIYSDLLEASDERDKLEIESDSYHYYNLYKFEVKNGN